MKTLSLKSILQAALVLAVTISLTTTISAQFQMLEYNQNQLNVEVEEPVYFEQGEGEPVPYFYETHRVTYLAETYTNHRGWRNLPLPEGRTSETYFPNTRPEFNLYPTSVNPNTPIQNVKAIIKDSFGKVVFVEPHFVKRNNNVPANSAFHWQVVIDGLNYLGKGWLKIGIPRKERIWEVILVITINGQTFQDSQKFVIDG